MPAIPRCNTKTEIRLQMILIILMDMAMIIGKTEFCIPINHPLKLYRHITAGAPKMQMLRYKIAASSTSGEVFI